MLPLGAIRKLREAKPNVAMGVGLSRGENPPEIFCEGPLWSGAEEQVGQDASWHIGSITKSMTSTLVMQQVDRGNLDLARPIGEYLTNVDEVHHGWRAITLLQLLSHTGGLAANPPFGQFRKWRDLDSAIGRRRVLEEAWRKPPKFRTGTHRYSNLGYMLAGLVLEDVLKMPWEDIVLQHIAKPLGLTSLGFGAPTGQSDPKGHQKRFFRLRPMSRTDVASDNPRWLGPAGTIHMSMKDMLAYGRAHLNALQGAHPEFLSQDSSMRMQTPASQNYALGWVIEKDIVWHNGSNTMWYALLMIDPESDTVFAATQNAMMRTQKIDALARRTLRAARHS